MFQKTIITLLFALSISMGGGLKLHPMVKSSLMPGWGESSMLYSERARIFRLSEILLWTTCIGAYTFSKHQQYVYQSFATEHAGVSATGKDRRFWVDIGNYDNRDDHNAEHLRFREMDELYEDTNATQWDWDTKTNRHHYETVRIRSDRFALTGKFLIGGIVLNHIVSAIDALYLYRLNKVESIRVMPSVSPTGESRINLQLDFNF